MDKKPRGEFADKLGRSNFNVPSEVLELWPADWTGLRLNRKDRSEVMEKYLVPDNYSMEVCMSDTNVLEGQQLQLDVAYKKGELYARDVMLINCALLDELSKEKPSLQLLWDMAVESGIMTLHQVGKLHEDRLTNVRRAFQV